MNEFSNHDFQRYLTDEPGLASDNYIQDDKGQRKRAEASEPELELTGQTRQ